MKEMNRREFLTLTGAAVVALSLAGCGGPSAPPAPPAVPTGKEAKVLEAINLYRKKAGVNEPLTMDDGLKPAAELTMKIAKGEMEYDEKASEALGKAIDGYIDVGAPIGIAFDKDTGIKMLVCVYSEDVAKMAQNLSLQLDEGAKANLKSPAITLVNIQTFEYSGVTYWVALIAESKVTA